VHCRFSVSSANNAPLNILVGMYSELCKIAIGLSEFGAEMQVWQQYFILPLELGVAMSTIRAVVAREHYITAVM
jgi:hypothetical protein